MDGNALFDIYIYIRVFISLKNITELRVMLQGNVCSCRAIAGLLVAQNIFFKCTIFSAHVIMFSSSCSHISPKNS